MSEKQVGDLGASLVVHGVDQQEHELPAQHQQARTEPGGVRCEPRRPYPQFVNTRFWRNDGENNYNALQFQVTRKMGALTFDGHYTMSHNMSNFLNLEDPYAPLAFNREQYNSRHRGVINTTWILPIGRGKSLLSDAPAVVDAALGGWQLGWIAYLQSGQFFSPSFSGADPSNTNSFGGRPDRIADGNLAAGSRQIDRWFDASAFAAPPLGRFGNSGTNVLEGPGWNLHHLSLLKRFNITERVGFVLQGLFQNVFNHPALPLPELEHQPAGSGGSDRADPQQPGKGRQAGDLYQSSY